MKKGQPLKLLGARIMADVTEAGANEHTKELAAALGGAVKAHGETTMALMKPLAGGEVRFCALCKSGAASYARLKVDLAMSNSHEYLNMTGHVVVGWMWLRQAVAAAKALGAGNVSPSDEVPIVVLRVG